MSKKNTAIRLNEIMKERNLTQADILRLCKPYCEQYGVTMNKSNLSQYCSLNNPKEPRQDKLTVLGLALNVTESWLMGNDVPKERTTLKSMSAEEDFDLIYKYNLLSEENKKQAVNYIDFLLSSQNGGV